MNATAITRIGRLLYGFSLVAVGIHQIMLRDFRPEILPPFPTWAHTHMIFPILIGIVLIISGMLITGSSAKNICLFLGFLFLTLVITCHLPYILFLSPTKATHLEVWFGAGEALAYSGGAFVMAGSFSRKPIPIGRIFFSLLIILFGCSHFVFPADVSAMVPKWLGAPLFWTYIVGAALIASGFAIIFKIWIKMAAWLLAAALFLFFLFFHLPDAIQNPSEGYGNEIVRAIICLQFCGIAMVIAVTNGRVNN
ncbi:MAG TPA: hypothetical protein VK543_04200 [Puia sp.]|nr:hypothetical protein [Puia sp.]